MSVIRIAARYAKSLLDLALDQNVLDEVVEDIQGFLTMLKNRDLYLLVKSPIVNVDKKRAIFDELFGGKVNKITAAFFDIILRKRREQYLPEIATEFLNQYKEYKGISTVHITSAYPLSYATIEKIKQKLQSANITKKEVEIKTSVDNSLIGGFVIRIDDKLIDASVAHRLKTIEKQILN